ncbi:MAG: helicase [Acidobacteria bacterium]|nr:helicase [Acidobacteriota bacterium]
MSTKFFTNADENTLLKKLTGIFQYMQVYHFDALVGYFRASGYFRIQDYMQQVSKVRILVGIDVDKHTADAVRKGLQFGLHNADVIDEAIKALKIDIQKAAYTKEIEDGMVRFIQEIGSGRIELRAHPSKNIHAKVYIFRQEHEHEHAGWGSVITGSSNLTESGLERNFEFNVELRDHDDVKFALATFETLWADGVAISAPKVQEVKQETYLNDSFTPFEVYMKFLIEHFGKSIDFDPNNYKDLPPGFATLRYQIDAVEEGFEKLRRYNGFFLSDVVGLGKTVVGTMIAKKFAIHNGLLTRVLVVHPPPLRRNWEDTINRFNLRFPVDYISCGSLHKVKHPENYDLIIVDEAHKFRSDTTDMFDNLQRLCKTPRRNAGPDGSRVKKVMLISATPLNNRPEDIRNLVILFQDGRNSNIDSVPNIISFFRPHIDMFNRMRKEQDRKKALANIRRMYEDIRNKIIKPLTIRRTRTDLEKNEAYWQDILAQGLNFPKIAPPQPIYYQLGEELGCLFDDTMKVLRNANHDGLLYYRYQAIKFLKQDLKKNYDRADSIAERLASIMRIQLVKRLDSSFFAFRNSLARYRDANDAMITMFERGRVHIAPNLKVNEFINDGREDELMELMDRMKETDPAIQTFKPEDFSGGFIEGLQHDQDLINGLTERWKHWRDESKDPKLVEFIAQLRGKMIHPSRNATSKLVIFSEFKDTTDYLKRELEKAGIERIITVDGHSLDEFRANVVRKNFDERVPKGERENDYDILITTEVLAEGVNLHRSHTILNYDTPWNSVRLMQRIGRVNRIGTKAKEIHIFNFYPTDKTEDQIALKHKAILKLQAFHSALGEDSQIYSDEEEYGTFGLFDSMGREEERDEAVRLLLMVRKFRADDPEWFKKIEHMPLRARCGRANGEPARGSVAFLKNKMRDGFYRIDSTKFVDEITFLQCAELLEAEPEEKSIPLPPHHHVQVGAAIDHYKEAQREMREESRSIERFGPNERGALTMLDLVLRGSLLNEEEKALVYQGIEAVKHGQFQHLQRDLNALRRNVKKNSLSVDALTSAGLRLLKKYPLNGNGNEEEHALDPLLAASFEEPAIIISETFA